MDLNPPSEVGKEAMHEAIKLNRASYEEMTCDNILSPSRHRNGVILCEKEEKSRQNIV